MTPCLLLSSWLISSRRGNYCAGLQPRPGPDANFHTSWGLGDTVEGRASRHQFVHHDPYRAANWRETWARLRCLPCMTLAGPMVSTSKARIMHLSCTMYFCTYVCLQFSTSLYVAISGCCTVAFLIPDAHRALVSGASFQRKCVVHISNHPHTLSGRKDQRLRYSRR